MIAALSVPCMGREPSPSAVSSSGLADGLAGVQESTIHGQGGFPARVLFVARKLVIKVTAGKDEPERCNQAFTVASTAVASGGPVSLWLTGESAWFGLPGRAEEFSLPHAAPLADLLAGVLAAGTVTVCTQCAARRDIQPDDLISGIRIAGAPTF